MSARFTHALRAKAFQSGRRPTERDPRPPPSGSSDWTCLELNPPKNPCGGYTDHGSGEEKRKQYLVTHCPAGPVINQPPAQQRHEDLESTSGSQKCRLPGSSSSKLLRHRTSVAHIGASVNAARTCADRTQSNLDHLSQSRQPPSPIKPTTPARAVFVLVLRLRRLLPAAGQIGLGVRAQSSERQVHRARGKGRSAHRINTTPKGNEPGPRSQWREKSKSSDLV